MIEIRLPVDAGLTQRLEDHFCEAFQQHWMLNENRLTGRLDLCGYFSGPEEMESVLADLRRTFPELPDKPDILELEDRDWKEAYKLHFKPWNERGLHWVPVWEKEQYDLPPGEEIVYLDPGMAFGTGNHETTRLCVRRLLDARDAWGPESGEKRIIDAGCGSGILAISARKLGFSRVYGFDLDPDSVRISLDNAELCDLGGRIDFRWSDLTEGLEGEGADLLLVNILANILCEHAELLCRSVNPGGWLVLSGILAREVREVHAVFAPLVSSRTGRLPEMDARLDGDWADLLYAF